MSRMGIDSTQISDLVLGKLPAEEALRLLEQIEHDPQASAELEARARLLAHVRGGGEFLFAGNVLAGSRARTSAIRRLWFRRPLAVFLLGAAALLLLAVVPLASHLTEGPFVGMARVGQPQYESLLRSERESDIELAVRMLRGGHSQEALLLLERFCRAYPDDPMREYAHYLAGAIYLADARQSLLGMFVSYDRSRVHAGMAHLKEALHDSQNPRLADESRWLHAKGCLMLDRPTEALSDLEVLRGGRGLRAQEAAQLIARIRSAG